MFYNNENCAFKILGVFYVDRDSRDIFESNRIHTAISYRILGSSTFFTGQTCLSASTGSITYIPARCDYRHTNEEAEQIIILHLQSMGQAEPTIQIEKNTQDLEPLFRTMLEVWEEGTPAAYNRCMALLYYIFEDLQRRQERSTAPIPKAIAPGIQLLRKSFRNPGLTVASLAAHCFVSEVYFRRVYHAYAGESPLQTLLNLRFQYACNLLRSGYYTTKQAAALSGFSDVKYFRTAFKKRFGKTVSEFTREHAHQRAFRHI